MYNALAPAYPSCLHTTPASVTSQRSSQIVPHSPSLHNSTRPSRLLVPPTRRTSPLVQTVGAVGKKKIHISSCEKHMCIGTLNTNNTIFCYN